MYRSAATLLLLCGPAGTAAVDNGIGLTPPMGWRAWKAFGAHISQPIMEDMMAEMVTQHPDGDGGTVSLKDLGYLYVGLDDHWQNCTTICGDGSVVPSWKPYCTEKKDGTESCDYDYQCCRGIDGSCNNTGAHSLPWYSDGTDGLSYGTPKFDTVRFPDVKGMVAKAHGLGLRAGWYAGNYQCSGANSRSKDQTPWDMARLVQGHAAAIKSYGFDSVKCDSGFGICSNMSLWAEFLNTTGRPVMIENCHQGADAPGIVADGRNDGNCTGLTTPVSDCPFNFWRTAGDPYPDWGTTMRELNTLRHVINPNYDGGRRSGSPEYNADPPRSRPGGWAYPGTMVVGDGGNVVNGTMQGGMTKGENRVHFGGWCIVSSPLVLAFNLSEPARHDLVWDIITNKEAIQINQAWAGHPGSQVLEGIGNNSAIEVWTKPLGHGRTAAFIVNTADKPKTDTTADDSAEINQQGVSSGNPEMTLAPCDTGRPSQLWKLFPNGDPTNVQVATPNGGCWEITGCSTGQNANVGTGYGCKSLPKHVDQCTSTPCTCNGAWTVNTANSTITSVMDNHCLQSSGASKGAHLSAGPCVPGDKAQTFVVAPATTGSAGTFTVAQNGLCVDNNVEPGPPPPTPPHHHGAGSVTIELAALKLGISGPVKVRDVWAKKDLPNSHTSFSTVVPYHDSIFLVFMPVGSAWPLPFELADWMKIPPPPVPTTTEP